MFVLRSVGLCGFLNYVQFYFFNYINVKRVCEKIEFEV